MRNEDKTKEQLINELREQRQLIAELKSLEAERKRAEETIQQQKSFSDAVIETADVIIVGLDLEGRVILFNRKAEEVTGYTRAEVMGKNFFKTFSLVEGENILARMFQRILTGKVVNPRDILLTTKSGETRFVNSRGTPFRNKKGKVIGVLGIGADVTEKRRMEQQLLQAEKLKSLGELAGGVAHDFNNVLAAILGNAQLLQMNIKSPLEIQERRKSIQDMNKRLDIIVKAARDGAETVKRIQEFARRKDKNKYFAQADINELINDALEFTRTRWKDDAESKGIKIDIQREFSPLPLTAGSAAELREVFTNLINNAVEAMPQGGKIKIKTFQEDDRVCIKVEDTGTGIANDRKDRIFDPFFTTKGVNSSGLGLSVSYGIINRHRGTILVDSVEGQGTTFTIKLPITERMMEEEVQPLSEGQKKASILVIEDEEEMRNLLYFVLIRGGHQVETVSGGRQGLKIFKKKKFDLVFTDLGMPGMSGWQVAEKIKSINGKVPVVLITGWGIDLKESEASKNWVDLIIHKPFEIDQVLRIVQEGIVLRERFKAV